MSPSVIKAPIHDSWHSKSAEAVLVELESSSQGLATNVVAERIKRFGPNALPQAPRSGWLTILLSQGKSPLVFILLGAAGLSFAIGDLFDTAIILLAVVLNTVLGFFQEAKANRSFEALRTFTQPTAQVRRDGVVVRLPTEALVPGDVGVFETGAYLPADGRLLQVFGLQINEAPLTGESVPVSKQTETLAKEVVVTERTNMVYQGTLVLAGHGEMVITATGAKTLFGQTAQLVSSLREGETPLQEQLRNLSRVLTIVVLLVALMITVIGVAQGRPLESVLILAAALAVAAIPEGLLVGLTVILAVGTQRMLKRKGLVRRLLAAETLGSVSVICTDKTGTLTEGVMRAEQIAPFGTESSAALLTAVVLCNNAVVEEEIDGGASWRLSGNPTEQALLSAGLEAGFGAEALAERYPRVGELPFSSASKFMATLHPWSDGKQMMMVKGAPEVVAKMMDRASAALLLKQAEGMTQQGFRVLAVAQGVKPASKEPLTQDDLHDLHPLGLIGLRDPLRTEAVETIAKAKQAGVRTVLITGDHPVTARAMAEAAGLCGSTCRVLTGAELDAMDDAQLAGEVSKIDVYARVLPAHKVRIVEAWKTHGASVAMIGDGVNDTPALKAADIGVALGSGTEVAKQTSEVVLLDNNLATLVAAIEQGRIMFDNLRKVVLYLLTDSFSEVVLIAGAFLLNLPVPILPAQILWINLVTDGLPHAALTMEPGEPGIMREKPRRRGEPIFSKEMRVLMFAIGLLTDLGLFVLYLYLLSRGMAIDEVRTFMFIALGIDSLLYVFSIRTLRRSVFRVNPFQNRWLVAAVVGGFVILLAPLTIPSLTRLFGFVPLSLLEWVVLLAIGCGKLLLIELVKWLFRRER